MSQLNCPFCVGDGFSANANEIGYIVPCGYCDCSGKVPDKQTAPFFVMMRPYRLPFEEKQCTVYVKEGDFFRAQGGLREEWGVHWMPIAAMSLKHARLKAHLYQQTSLPQWHLQEETQ